MKLRAEALISEILCVVFLDLEALSNFFTIIDGHFRRCDAKPFLYHFLTSRITRISDGENSVVAEERGNCDGRTGGVWGPIKCPPKVRRALIALK